MTVIVETGNGIRNANAYAPSSFVTTYLTSNNRETDWVAAGATVQDAAVIEATAYIEKAWGKLFKGTKQFVFDDVKSAGAILFTGLPTDTETLTLGDQVYTFVAALSSPEVFNEVLIGADAAGSASNLFDAFTVVAAGSGVTYGVGTQANRHATFTLTGAQIDMEAIADGSSGDYTAITGPVTNVTLTAFAGGDDGGSQPLSFPQAGLVDRAGQTVVGVPLKLKQSMAEYADRARVALLAPDPTVDAVGGSVTLLKTKVGPIEKETAYSDGTSGNVILRPYPAADLLLSEYVFPAGQAVR